MGIFMPITRAPGYFDLRDLPPADVIFGRTPAMAAAHEKLERVANTTIPVLLQGESGTGKDILAKLLHLRSGRANFPWIKVTCPAIPSALLESELFGYERGAFTGAYATKRGRVEMAHQGTLYLDEVVSLDIPAQAKLLQVVQDGTFTRVGGQELRRVNTRLICASSRDLRKQTEDGTFRLDFFFRINALTIDLPPLRQRLVDLPALVEYFLNIHSRSFGLTAKPLSREILLMMQRFDWPGNIRQLENMIRSYVLIGNEEALAAELIPSPPPELLPEIDQLRPISLKEITKAATRQLERQIILKVLHVHHWNRRKAAKWLNISYRSLLYKLQESQLSENPGAVHKPKPPAPEPFPAPEHKSDEDAGSKRMHGPAA